jgi:hypothetical protein
LEEFQEPKKRGTGAARQETAEPPGGSKKVVEGHPKSGLSSLTNLKRFHNSLNLNKHVPEDPLKLESLAEGPQPLRLLACGHVFHVRSTEVQRVSSSHK